MKIVSDVKVFIKEASTNNFTSMARMEEGAKNALFGSCSRHSWDDKGRVGGGGVKDSK